VDRRRGVGSSATRSYRALPTSCCEPRAGPSNILAQVHVAVVVNLYVYLNVNAHDQACLRAAKVSPRSMACP
jgi:hypothetical protein